jgi:hypothetical protein
MKRHVSSLLSAVLCALTVFAQSETGRVGGVITDANGAALVGVTVTLTNVGTNREIATKTDEAGRYVSVPLAIGNYRVTAALPGFKRTLRSGIILQVGETANVDITMLVGEINQEIEVTADASLLKTNEASQGQIIDSRRIVDLPLNGRDYLNLALLSGGTTQAGGTFGGFSASGVRNTQNNFMLDGLDNNNNQIFAYAGRGEAVKPSVDGIQEFLVLTNSYSAQYGRAAGGVVNIAIKSGTNDFHGTAFEFIRNEALDARNFFAPVSQKKPPFKRNQFGFSFGGPVIKNKTFFFGDYEGTRIRESSIFNNTVATAKMRQGDFSALGVTIYDPATYDPVTGTRQPFQGNIIPANRIDPVARKVAALLPATTNANLSLNYLRVAPRREDVNKFDVRVDHNFSEHDNAYFRHSFSRSRRPDSSPLPGPLYSGLASQTYSDDGWNSGAVWNHTFSPSLTTSTRVGYSKILTILGSPTDKNLNAEVGLKGVSQTLPGGAHYLAAGYSQMGLGAFLPIIGGTSVRQIKNDTSWIKGGHTLTFGGDVMYRWEHSYGQEFANGRFFFNGRFTNNPKTGTGGDGFADFLLGIPNSSIVSTFQRYYAHSWLYSFYANDEWRVSRRLTLNAGVRYELYTWPYEINNGIANFDIDANPANPQLVFPKDGSNADRSTVAADTNNFAPRLGFTYQIGGRTVLRGGYGIFFANNEGAGGSQWIQQNPPFVRTVTLATDNITPGIILGNGVPDGTLDVKNLSNISLSSYERHPDLGYSQQWNLNIQRELAKDWLIEVGYYGSKSVHLLRRWDGNYALPGPGNVNARRRWRSVLLPGSSTPITPVSTVNIHRFDGSAEFNSLQAKVERRFARGFTLLASYNWSKTMSDMCQPANGTGCGGSNIQNPINQRAEWAVDDGHIGHRFVASYIWTLPFGGAQRWGKNWNGLVDAALGGWNLSGILTLTSGIPVNLAVAGNPSNSTGSDRPNVIGDPRAGDRTIDRWFNTAAFAPNAQFTYGSAGRNLLTAPPYRNFDFAALKNFRVTERVTAQFRFEAFNFTNTPFFSPPNATVGSRDFGRISSAGRPRNLQLGMKIIF